MLRNQRFQRRIQISKKGHDGALRRRIQQGLTRRLLHQPLNLRLPVAAPRLPRLAVPLPESLAERLRAIPGETLMCADVERLYPTPGRRAGSRDFAVVRHLVHCSRCRELYGRLELAFSVPRSEPTAEQMDSWRAVARGRWAGPPAWLRDNRFAVAASFILTALLLLPLGPSAPHLLQFAERTSVSARHWLLTGAQQKSTWLQSMETSLAASYERGKHHLEIHSHSYAKLYHRTLDLFGLTSPDVRPESLLPSQGEHHGRAT